MEELDAKGVYVVCEGVHFCMRSRGVKKQDASMVTSAIRGVFEESSEARQEFLSLIKG
jgi:GTP cyclohydrolase I